MRYPSHFQAYLHTVFILCVLYFCAPLSYATHYLSVSGQVGYSGTHYGLSESSPIGNSLWGNGCHAGLGIGYELEYRHFLFSVGAGIAYGNSFAGYAQEVFLPDQNDHDHGSLNDYDNIYDLYRTTDTDWSYQSYQLVVPLFVGFEFASFYTKVGAVFSVPFGGQIEERTLVTDKADYHAFDEDFNSHPLVPLGQTPHKMDSKGTFSLLQLSPAIELGYSLALTRGKLRIGLYAEYGMLSLQAPSIVADLQYWSFVQQSTELRAGIRFTYLLPGTQRKFPCRCLIQ